MPQLTLLRELRYAAWVPVYLAVFFLVERIPRSHYWATQLPIDDYIPFLEGFVVFYCMWYFFLVASGLYLLFGTTPPSGGTWAFWPARFSSAWGSG